MKDSFSYREIPQSRIATFDIFSIGLRKHHVSALLEFDVTESRKKLQQMRREGVNISFNAWILKAISNSLKKYPEAAAFLYSKRKLMLFDDINISILVEKKSGNTMVPIPLVIEKTNEKSAWEITQEIENAKNQNLSASDVVLSRESGYAEKLYYHFPGSLRRTVWRMMLNNPRFAFKKMGNVVVTSVGMMGKINGWFIHKSVHPLSFGMGSVIKKPVVSGNEIIIREILNMTILIDHDVIDGAPMVRLLNELTKQIENPEL